MEISSRREQRGQEIANLEGQIDVVRNVSVGSKQFPSQCDLYITNKRLVVIRSQFKKHNFSQGGGIIGGLLGLAFINTGLVTLRIGILLILIFSFIGGIIGMRIDKTSESRNKQKYERLRDLTLDDLLKGNKKNFVLFYEDIVKLRFYKFGLQQDLEVTTKDTQKNIGLTSEQFNRLGNVFSGIDALKGKIEK